MISKKNGSSQSKKAEQMLEQLVKCERVIAHYVARGWFGNRPLVKLISIAGWFMETKSQYVVNAVSGVYDKQISRCSVQLFVVDDLKRQFVVKMNKSH